MAETALALLFERALPYPSWLERAVGHPVMWIGRAIDGLDQSLNRPERSDRARRAAGVGTVLGVGVAAGLCGLAAQRLAGPTRRGTFAKLLLAWPGLAQRSLRDHVEAVHQPLHRGDLPAVRLALARIVGRDVERLDVEGVAAAALESLAESFNDGVVAPAFWLAVAGLPGLWVYKAVNTADSMIGHREPRWRAFGWGAARLDDILNLVPARMAGALIALAGGGWATMLRDAPGHASPNAGWPEAAMAGALGVQLGGEATYDGVAHDRARFGQGSRPGAVDLERGLKVYGRACILLALGLGAAELLVRRRR